MRLLFDLLAGSDVFGSVLAFALSRFRERGAVGLGWSALGVFTSLVSAVSRVLVSSGPALESSRVIESVPMAPATGVFDDFST